VDSSSAFLSEFTEREREKERERERERKFLKVRNVRTCIPVTQNLILMFNVIGFNNPKNQIEKMGERFQLSILWRKVDICSRI
jgi:hypothetical protein